MPGTILVSGSKLPCSSNSSTSTTRWFFLLLFPIHFTVLEFMDLPLSSSTSIRVSMGKIEYQISDKGNFSFPLTSLRDDLIVRIQDADGNEISRTGVHIRLILEKGVWEDIFPLGGGHLHLKLQFILNDEERDRIRIMRQSALKKKHDELLSSSRSGAESDSSTIIGNVALPLRTNDEVSESPKKHLQYEAVSQLQSPVAFCDDKESGARNVVGSQPNQKQLNPNIADQYKEASSTKPVTQAVNLPQLQHKGKKPANQSPSVKHPQRITGSEEMAILLRSSEQIEVVTNNQIQPNLGGDGLQYSEEKNPPGRTPSNVRKMISAFESGLTQDLRSHIKPPPTKYQSSKIETKDSSKTQHLEQDKSWNTVPAGFLQERVKSASLVRDLQQAQVYIGESRKKINLLNHVSPKDTRQLKELSTINILNKQTDSNARNKLKVAHKTDIEEEKYNKDPRRTSTFETVTVSQKMPEKHSDRNHPCKLFGSKQDYRSIPKKEEVRRGNASEGSYELCIQRDSPQKLDSVVHFHDKYYSFESSGVWIFPDEQRKICITTSGKRVMGIVQSQDTKRISHQRSLDFSKLGNVEKNAAYVGTGTEGSKYEKIQEIEESKTKSSDDNEDENSGGPINQVIKVAIIIGFGILVLLTRQRKRR